MITISTFFVGELVWSLGELHSEVTAASFEILNLKPCETRLNKVDESENCGGKHWRTVVRRAQVVVLMLAVLPFTGCGGNGGSTMAPPPGDFKLVVSSQSLVVNAGGAQSLTFSVDALNGFSGTVQISISGEPSEITASATSFALVPGGQLQVTFSTQNTATYATGTITVQGTSGNLSHSAAVDFTVLALASSEHAPVRTRYLRTDAFYDPNSLQFAPPNFTIYDQALRRFFVSNPFVNRIDVFDATNEVEIGMIPVPGAWGIDLSPDGSKLYAGTLFGAVYQIDPSQMQITNIYPTGSIGPNGYTATEALVLADGRLALLGHFGSFDGSPSFAIWDPGSNSLTTSGCGNTGAFALSGDRTKVLSGSIDSDGTVCSYDPATGQVVTGSYGTFLSRIIPTPDGKKFLVNGGAGVAVYDVATAQQLGLYAGVLGSVLSLDGTTLYGIDPIYGGLLAYDTTSYQEKGWVANYSISDAQDTIVPGAIDETGLIVGPIGHGVAFVDGSQIQPGTQSPQIGLGFPQPNTGPVAGGTAVQVTTSSGVQNLNSFPTLTLAYIGNAPLANVSYTSTQGNFPTIAGTTTGAPASAVMDFTAVFSNNNVGIMPESFSYGPTILEVVSNAATADGGGTGAIFGYGLADQSGNAQVQLGGTSVTGTTIFSAVPYVPYPFPVQGLQFTVPPGTAGTVADVSVTNANGSATAPQSFYYANAAVAYPLANAQLQQGVYDPHRDAYYFADQSKVQVLSLASGGWQSPITVAGTGPNTQFTALSLSADGSKLAISDFGGRIIYVVNPGSPSSAQAFAVPQGGMDAGMQPTGLGVLNSGVIYFSTAGSGAYAFHKLDTTTGTFTDYTQFPEDPISTFIRVFVSPDQSRVFSCIEGIPFFVDTSTGEVSMNYTSSGLSGSLSEMAMSADGSTLVVNGFFVDTNLNPTGLTAYNDREVFLPSATIGQKLNDHATVMFQPLGDGIDMLDVATGRLVYRVQLSTALASVYDNLVADASDNTVVVITGAGVTVVDLNSLNIAQSAFGHKTALSNGNAQVRSDKIVRTKGRSTLRGPQLGYVPQLSCSRAGCSGR